MLRVLSTGSLRARIGVLEGDSTIFLLRVRYQRMVYHLRPRHLKAKASPVLKVAILTTETRSSEPRALTMPTPKL